MPSTSRNPTNTLFKHLAFCLHALLVEGECCYFADCPDFRFIRLHIFSVDTPKIALHMQGTDLHPKEPNPELPHVIPLIPGIIHYVQESSEEL